MPHFKIAILNLLSLRFDHFPVLLASFQSDPRSLCLRQSGLPSWILTKWVKWILQNQVSQEVDCPLHINMKDDHFGDMQSPPTMSPHLYVYKRSIENS